MKVSHGLLALLLLVPAGQALADPAPADSDPGFEKPAAAEREAYGFDPEGVEYRQNRTEDFQVVLVETAPFAGLASYGLTVLTSLAVRGKTSVNGAYFTGFVIGTGVLSVAAAAYSVSGKPYPAPRADLGTTRTAWAVQVPVAVLRF